MRNTTDFSKSENPPAWAYVSHSDTDIPNPLEYKDVASIRLGREVDPNNWTVEFEMRDGRYFEKTGYGIRDANELIGSFVNWKTHRRAMVRARRVKIG